MKLARKGAGVAVVDRKIYVMGGCQFKFNKDEINQVEVFDPNTQTWEVGPLGFHTIYDTKDGTCENLEIPHEYTMKISKAKKRKRVKGLRCDVGRHVVECNGKLALLWEDSEEKIWCAMIALDKVGVEIHGRVEWSKFFGYVHRDSYWSCLGLSL
ncbi:hypothetical protein Bca4012_007745 [Brassica carinata]